MNYQVRDEVIDQIWHDLGEQLPRPRVAEVAQDIAASLGDATITTFIPLFVCRLARDRLTPEIQPSVAGR